MPADRWYNLLRSVLENNIFEFDGKLFIQKIGVAIGECQTQNAKFEKYHNIYFYGRYRDEGFLIYRYHGMKIKLKHFLQ
jgi:hypothetical protein